MAELGPALLLCFGQATRPELSVFHMGRAGGAGGWKSFNKGLGRGEPACPVPGKETGIHGKPG